MSKLEFMTFPAERCPIVYDEHQLGMICFPVDMVGMQLPLSGGALRAAQNAFVTIAEEHFRSPCLPVFRAPNATPMIFAKTGPLIGPNALQSGALPSRQLIRS